jgi:hypothetical protein
VTKTFGHVRASRVRGSADKGLQAPFTDWAFVQMTCQQLARQLLKLELAAELPLTLDAAFVAPGKHP